MSRLNPIEQECQDLLVLIQDMMAPGHPMTTTTHTEIAGRVRDALIKLRNKEYGCQTGRHSGNCSCPKEERYGHSLPAR